MIRFTLLILLFISATITLAFSQTVDAHYINPKYVNHNRYEFFRIGTQNEYYAAFMHNRNVATYGPNNSFTILTYNNRDLSFYTGNGNLIVFPEGGGGMGVGTADLENYKFSIKQSSAQSGRGFRIHNSENAKGLQLWVSTNSSIIDAEGTNSLKLQTAGIDRVFIANSGNVGIGTNVIGSHKLAVEGSIGAREVKVESQGWSDFVFNDDYELQDLATLESYILQNKHLPAIPSEKEIITNGINLGEMDKLLLQKIEELTLYLIEQNKQLLLQQDKIEKLEERLGGQ